MRIAGRPELGGIELLHPGPGIGAPAEDFRIIEGGLLRGGEAPLFVPRPGPVRAVSTPRGMVFAHAIPGGTRLERLRGDRVEALRDLPGAVLSLHGRGVVWARGADVHVEDHEGRAWPVPLGARTRTATPADWGLCWTEGRTLFRWRPGRGVSVATTLPSATGRLWTGPDGMVLADTRKGAVLCVPGQGPQVLDGLEGRVHAADLSVDVVVEDDDGVALIEDGEVIDRRESGRVGCAGQWLDEAGDLRAWDEEDDVPTPGAVVAYRGALHGPGGLAWDLESGEPVDIALSSGAELALAGKIGVVALVDDELRIVIPASSRVPEGGSVLAARVPPGVLPIALEMHDGSWALRTDHGSFRDDLHQGMVPCDLPARRSPPLPPAAAALPLPLDGAMQAPDGSIWAWQDLGVLLRIAPAR